MVGKREMSEDMYDMDPQHLYDMAKAKLPESQSPAVDRILVGNMSVTRRLQ